MISERSEPEPNKVMCDRCHGHGWKMIRQLSGALDEETCHYCDGDGFVPLIKQTSEDEPE